MLHAQQAQGPPSPGGEPPDPRPPSLLPGAAPDLQRIHNFQHVADLGAGNFGVARLMLDKGRRALVAVKFIERGDRIDRNVEREIMNHSTLDHPHIVAFKEVFLTPTHLAIVMEYAAGGELFDRIVRAGRFSEDESRYFFQQLISGVDYCHRSGICHRDLKLENTLLDNNPAPRLKICDFGYSKSSLDSMPKSTVGTPAYIAPEVLQRQQYDGRSADVWSCGVTLFVMLVGAYPFEDPADPRNFRKTIQRIMSVSYALPPGLPLSAECRDLLARIFVASPAHRITIPQIRQHPWFRRNLPAELQDGAVHPSSVQGRQGPDEIRNLIHAARVPAAAPPPCLDMVDEGELMADDLGDAGASMGPLTAASPFPAPTPQQHAVHHHRPTVAAAAPQPPGLRQVRPPNHSQHHHSQQHHGLVPVHVMPLHAATGPIAVTYVQGAPTYMQHLAWPAGAAAPAMQQPSHVPLHGGLAGLPHLQQLQQQPQQPQQQHWR